MARGVQPRYGAAITSNTVTAEAAIWTLGGTSQARLPGELVRCRSGVAGPRVVRLWVPGSESGRLSTMRFITIVEVMRWTPGKVASVWSRSAA